MSELTMQVGRIGLRNWLLTTSSLPLFSVLGALSPNAALGADAFFASSDHPSVWVELGGQFDQIDGSEQLFSPRPPTYGSLTSPPFDHPVPTSVGGTAKLGWDGTARLSYLPDNSDWKFEASVRYGRSHRGPRLLHDQSYKTGYKYGHFTTNAFFNALTTNQESHAVLDFQAGLDIGLGLVGHGASILKLGIRFAQFNSHSDAHVSSRPFLSGHPLTGPYGGNFDDFLHADRRFSGIGPSIAWEGSAPFAGSLEDGFSVDWGANAALLIGKQKAKVTESQTLTYAYYAQPQVHEVLYSASHNRDRTTVIPNLGGFAGFSYRLPVAKISLGYRADFFWGAMDGGNGARKTYDRNFFGPFASISIGFGG